MEVKEISIQAFNKFTLTNECANYYQSDVFTKMKEKEGWKSYYLGGMQDGQIVAATIILYEPMFKKYNYCVAVKGFLMDYSNVEQVKLFTNGVRNFLKEHNAIFLRINPSFFTREYDGDGNPVKDGFDHSSYRNNLTQAGFTYEGEKRGLNMQEHVQWIYVLPLENKSEDDIRKNMSKLTQRNIKHAQKCHVEVKEIVNKSDLSIFMEIMRETGDRRNFSIFDEAYYQDLFDSFMPQNQIRFVYAQLHVAAYIEDLKEQVQNEEKKLVQFKKNLEEKGENEKTRKKMDACKETLLTLEKKKAQACILQETKGDVFPISCANFMMYQGEIVYFHGGSYKEFMQYCGQFAIQWDSIEYGLKHSFKRFNFNGISGIFDESAPDYGVFTFKKGFGGHVEQYVGYFHCKISPYVYALYAVLRKCKHLIKR